MTKGRREDLRLVTGRGAYTADHHAPGEAFGVFVRADRAHARIVTINVAAAQALPGVLRVYTSQDVIHAKLNELPVTAFFRAQSGASLKVPPHPILASERVRFIGEPVVLVVGESQAIAEDGAERIAIEYSDLPAVVDAADAVAPDAPVVHRDVPGNIAMDYDFGDRTATQAALASAAHVVELTVEAQRIIGNPLEPKSCMVNFHPATGVFDVYAPSQGAADIQATLAHVFSLPAQSIRVCSRDVGGAFGVRGEVYPEYVAVMLAARDLVRPVKWIGTRAETMVSDYHGRDAKLTGALALDASGQFLALQINWLVNLGAYCSNAGAFINTVAAPTSTATNAYRIPTVYGLHRLVLTNTTPGTAYRGAGRPNVAYLAERLIDEAARVTGFDRVELRRMNLIRRAEFPYKTPMGSVYDSGDPEGLLAQALKSAGWTAFESRRREAKRRGKLRGIGCAVFIEPSGNPGQEEVAIKFDADGCIHMYSKVGPSGQGHETAFSNLVAGILGIDAERITLHYNDPDAPQLAGLGSFGSRSALSHGAAFRRGADEVLRKAKELAAAELEVAAGDLTLANGAFRVGGTDLAFSFEQILRKYAAAANHPLDVTMKIDTATTYPGGAHVAEVEIDPETGVLEIVSYIAVDDCGNMLNPMIVEGQLHGGLMQGIGQVIGEFCAYERVSGQLLTGTFMDYFMPRADSLPRHVSFQDRSIPSPNNILGVKGVGEAGTTGSIPTLANAVIDALGRHGIHHLDMPFTSNRLWAALQTRPWLGGPAQTNPLHDQLE